MIKKFYLSGEITGNYRSQNIIKFLADSDIPFFLLSPRMNMTNIIPKKLGGLLKYIALILTIPIRVLLIINSTHLLVLPMNWSAIVYLEIIVAKFFRKKIIVDFYISIYDTLIDARRISSEKSFSAKLHLNKDRFLLKLADKIIFLNKSESIYYQNRIKYELNGNKIFIIPLVIDYKKEIFSKLTNTNTSTNSEFNICWWGTYIPLHGLENIIESFAFLTNKEIKLYIFGNSDEKSKPYLNLINKLGLENNIIINNEYSFANGKLAPFLIEKCDLALGNFGQSEKAKTVLVNKLVDSLALGLPCLTIATKATEELLKEGDGIIYSSSTPLEISKKIQELSIKRSYLKTVGKNGFEVYLKKFSPDVFKMELNKIIT